MDTDAPVAIFKRSKARTTRTRDVSPANDAPEDKGEPLPAPSTLAARLKKQHKERAKPKARLSFGADEEEGDGEAFQVKKSNLGRRLKLSSNSGIGLPSSLDNAADSPSSSIVYSKEYLSELKASTQSTPSAAHSPKDPADSEMVLDASEMAGAVIVDEESTSGTTAEIPSGSTVAMAKQRRERMRKEKTVVNDEEDFISLSVTRRENVYQGPHPESRLMREEDDLGEGDDEFAEYTAAQERIALGKKARKKEASNRRAEMQELLDDAEEDDETIQWEREQLRRGAHQVPEAPDGRPTKQEYRPTQIPPPTVLPTLDAAISKLGQSLTQLTLSHTSSTTSMSNLADERVALEGKERDMRIMVEKAESKRSWFDSFREWVETVATFLDEKYPRLEELEEEFISILKERNDMITKRRRQDDEDDLDLFLGSPPSREEPEELDELGRVVPNRNSAVARRERRKSRASRHQRHAHQQEEEGFSSDGSLPPSDEADYQVAMASLQEKVSNVLEDVRSEEFRDPRKGVAVWFGKWRENYSDTYSGAFGGLGMVNAWEFWVRLEMLGWDPISDPRTLDSFAWFNALYDYSRPPVEASGDGDEGVDTEPPLGTDGDLASAMLSTIVPHVCKVIQGGAFDPYSAKHVRAAIDLAEQVEASATPEKFELLKKSVFSVFRRAVDDHAAHIQPYLELLDRSSPKFDPEAVPARRRFLSRRYKLLTDLVRWKKYTGEEFGAGEMIEKIVGQCMRPIAETGWEVGGEEIMQKAVNILSPEIRSRLSTGI